MTEPIPIRVTADWSSVGEKLEHLAQLLEEQEDEIKRLRKMLGQSRSWVTFDEEYRA